MSVMSDISNFPIFPILPIPIRRHVELPTLRIQHEEMADPGVIDRVNRFCLEHKKNARIMIKGNQRALSSLIHVTIIKRKFVQFTTDYLETVTFKIGDYETSLSPAILRVYALTAMNNLTRVYGRPYSIVDIEKAFQYDSEQMKDICNSAFPVDQRDRVCEKKFAQEAMEMIKLLGVIMIFYPEFYSTHNHLNLEVETTKVLLREVYQKIIDHQFQEKLVRIERVASSIFPGAVMREGVHRDRCLSTLEAEVYLSSLSDEPLPQSRDERLALIYDRLAEQVGVIDSSIMSLKMLQVRVLQFFETCTDHPGHLPLKSQLVLARCDEDTVALVQMVSGYTKLQSGVEPLNQYGSLDQFLSISSLSTVEGRDSELANHVLDLGEVEELEELSEH